LQIFKIFFIFCFISYINFLLSSNGVLDEVLTLCSSESIKDEVLFSDSLDIENLKLEVNNLEARSKEDDILLIRDEKVNDREVLKEDRIERPIFNFVKKKLDLKEVKNNKQNGFRSSEFNNRVNHRDY
jgi:hypothetical protein